MNDTKELLKEKLTAYLERVTKQSRSGLYVCPLCGSGTGPRQTGALSVREGRYWKCFSCGEGGDIFTLCGLVEGLDDYGQQAAFLEDAFGLEGDLLYKDGAAKAVGTKKTGKREATQAAQKTVGQALKHDKAQKPDEIVPQEAKVEITDYSSFFLAAHGHISDTDYPSQRGLGADIIRRFKLGFEPSWRHPKAPNAPLSPRLIIPTSDHSYLARDVRSDIPDVQKPYSKSQVGPLELFNAEALQTATKPLFIVEGALDALSIMEVGGEAVALGTTAKVKSFLDRVRREKPCQPLILAFDNDAAGVKASQTLAAGLLSEGIPYYAANVAGQCKDANEALQRSREAFSLAVADAENKGDEEIQAKEREEERLREEYKATSAGNSLIAFLELIEDSAYKKTISTGFTALDFELDGGLHEGLYVVGAISSLGKTTLMTQIADQVAQNGIDVLIFSLEMSKTEIMAKSVSRHTLLRCVAERKGSHLAKTTRGILTGSRFLEYSMEESTLIYQSMDDYRDYSKHIYISEGIGDIGVKEIRATIEKHINYTGNTPVVVVDYLQIIAPYSDRSTDKQNTDKAVLELKRMSRDFKIPVVGISSFNRASYKETVTMEAFKESGAIEYSSDVLLGLQLKGAGDKDFDATEAKRKSPREVELVVLKNRNGRVGGKVDFQYYPLFNYFREV
ncbi:MAG: DnaB-like helicase C-terminal domain-containing protein [Pseudomonadota bacterium]